MTLEYGLCRHTLAWIAPQGRHALRHPDDARPIVASWLAHDWPLIVRRSEAAAATPLGWIGLGIPTAPAEGKRRIGVWAPGSALSRLAPLPLLADVAERLPPPWAAPVLELLRRARTCGIGFRVFGSAAWQAITGSNYLTVRSDIDLLWRPRDARQLESGIALLDSWEGDSGLRADGEILFGHDMAVAWREWKQTRESGNSRILVKSMRSCRIVEQADLMAHLRG